MSHDHFPIIFPKSRKRVTVSPPKGFKKILDDFIAEINFATKAKISRNEFVVTAIYFFFKYLRQSKDFEEVLKKIKENG